MCINTFTITINNNTTIFTTTTNGSKGSKKTIETAIRFMSSSEAVVIGVIRILKYCLIQRAIIMMIIIMIVIIIMIMILTISLQVILTDFYSRIILLDMISNTTNTITSASPYDRC